ncbi:unnamed protein product [Boreogadus saida]
MVDVSTPKRQSSVPSPHPSGPSAGRLAFLAASPRPLSRAVMIPPCLLKLGDSEVKEEEEEQVVEIQEVEEEEWEQEVEEQEEVADEKEVEVEQQKEVEELKVEEKEKEGQRVPGSNLTSNRLRGRGEVCHGFCHYRSPPLRGTPALPTAAEDSSCPTPTTYAHAR